MEKIEKMAERYADNSGFRSDREWRAVKQCCFEIATKQDSIARAEERKKAELNFCIFCSSYDNCDARYSCKTFEKFHNAMMEE